MEGVYVRYASGAMGERASAEASDMLAQQVIHRATLAREVLASLT